jgi:hypothetical protein
MHEAQANGLTTPQLSSLLFVVAAYVVMGRVKAVDVPMTAIEW